MTSPLLLLAEKVEGLSGLDRRIDAEIAHAVGDAQMRDGTLYAWCEAGSTTERVRAAPYTSSVDTAMRLVPDGWGWFVSQPNEKTIASGLLKNRTPVMGEVQYGCDHRYAVAAATPALALVAAALRARAATAVP